MLRKRWVKWEQKIEKLEKLVKRKEMGKDKDRSGNGEMENRLKEVERMLKRKEKEERKRNIVVKRVRVKKKSMREAVEIEVEIEKMSRIEDREKGKKMVWVKLGKKKHKWEVIEKKRNLQGRKEKIKENLTWKEIQTRWRLRRIARLEEEGGNRVWVRQEKIRIGEK